MELNQIKHELSQVEQVINRAAQAIQKDGAAPQELKDYVKELDSKSKQARQLQDAARLAQFIDDMEATSEQAKTACEKSGKLGSPAKNAVLLAHRQLTALKSQLH